MGYLSRDPGFVYMTHAELSREVVASGGDYWIGGVFRNDHGKLGLFLQFKGDETMHSYELTMPDLSQFAEGMTGNRDSWADIYPAPWQWHYAVHKRLIRSYSVDEWMQEASGVAIW